MPMTFEQFEAITDAVLAKAREVMIQKDKDYAAHTGNALANFEGTAARNDMSPMKVIDIFAQKHQQAIDAYRKTGKLESEALEMRFVDRINYLMLELMQAIALGYVPQEMWLLDALGVTRPVEPVDAMKIERDPGDIPGVSNLPPGNDPLPDPVGEPDDKGFGQVKITGAPMGNPKLRNPKQHPMSDEIRLPDHPPAREARDD